MLSAEATIPVFYYDPSNAGAAYAVIAAMAQAEGSDAALIANAYWLEHQALARQRFTDAFAPGEAS